jgi:hypothetical protein
VLSWVTDVQCDQELEPIPKGLLKIAQGFNLGTSAKKAKVPKGRLNSPGLTTIQPSLRDFDLPQTANPTLKGWAIVSHPFGVTPVHPNQPRSRPIETVSA